MIFASTKYGQLLSKELHRGKWNQLTTKPSPKSRKHQSKPKTSWIVMRQSVLASSMWAETNSDQLLFTELCQGKWKLCTQTLPKSTKHWSEVSKSWIVMEHSLIPWFILQQIMISEQFHLCEFTGHFHKSSSTWNQNTNTDRIKVVAERNKPDSWMPFIFTMEDNQFLFSIPCHSVFEDSLKL